MRSEQEIKKQVVGVRDRVKELSGFWLGEGAAMIYVLEWVLGKQETAPAGELGRSGGNSEKIAGRLVALAEQAAASAATKAPTSARKKPAAATAPAGPAPATSKAPKAPKPSRRA